MSILFRKPPHTWDPSKLLREEGYPSLNIFWLEDLLETWLVGNLQPLRNILSESIFHSDDVFPLVKLTGDSISEEEYIVLNALPAKLAFKQKGKCRKR